MVIELKKTKRNMFMLGVLAFTLCFLMMYFSYANNDWIWNYGFSYNVSKGMNLYRDFNMVITPLYPFIMGNLLKIFGSNILSYCFLNASILTIMFLFLRQKKNKIWLPIWILILYVMAPNYNMWCLFFFFILYSLEEEKKSDYLIGLVLGLIFLTKTSFILLVLPSLYYYKEPQKIWKRFLGFCLPVSFFLIYFTWNQSLYDFFNYVFGSLFDFSSKNFQISFGLAAFGFSVAYLIYSFWKTKDIKALYTLFFQIMSYPIFNFGHVYYSFIIFAFYVLDTKEINIPKYCQIIMIPLLFMPLVGIGMRFLTEDFAWGTNRLENKLVIAKYKEDANLLNTNLEQLDKAVFVVHEAYYYKFLLDLDINKYDLLLNGNNGYDSVNRILNEFAKMPLETQYILNSEYPSGGQLMQEIDSYIRENYERIGYLEDFVIYQRTK